MIGQEWVMSGVGRENRPSQIILSEYKEGVDPQRNSSYSG